MGHLGPHGAMLCMLCLHMHAWSIVLHPLHLHHLLCIICCLVQLLMRPTSWHVWAQQGSRARPTVSHEAWLLMQLGCWRPWLGNCLKATALLRLLHRRAYLHVTTQVQGVLLLLLLLLLLYSRLPWVMQASLEGPCGRLSRLQLPLLMMLCLKLHSTPLLHAHMWVPLLLQHGPRLLLHPGAQVALPW